MKDIRRKGNENAVECFVRKVDKMPGRKNSFNALACI